MLPNNRPIAQTLGPSGPDIIKIKHFQHAVAHDPRDDGDSTERQGDRGQNEMMYAIEEQVEIADHHGIYQ